MKQQIQLSDHFTYGRLIRFTLPSIGMMICTSVYSVVDGFFVSDFAGKTPFAAINLIMPFLIILSTVGFMFGTGGSAIVAKTFGEGDKKKGNQFLSLFVYVAAALGILRHRRKATARSYKYDTGCSSCNNCYRMNSSLPVRLNLSDTKCCTDYGDS